MRFFTLSRCLLQFGALGLLLLQGCSSNPMGLSDQEWNALPLEKRAEMTERQAAIDRAREENQARQRAESEARAAAEARAEDERIAARYANARYGDIVTLTLEEGGARFGGKLCRFEPVSIDLFRGETTVVTLRRHDKTWLTNELEVELSADGNTVLLGPRERNRFVAINRGWERGQTYQVTFVGRSDEHAELRDSILTLRYKRMSPGFRRDH